MDKAKAIETAKKLLAMAADCSSPNEAAIAARRARSIMDKYQLSNSDLAERTEFGAAESGVARKKIPLWEQSLCISVANLNDCVALIRNGRFIFQGFEEDAQIASFMMGYLVEHGKRMAKRYAEDNPWGSRGDFKIGYGEAIRYRVHEMIREREKNLFDLSGKSLVVVKKNLVEQEFGQAKYGERKQNKEIDQDSLLQGQKAGMTVNIVTGASSDIRDGLTAKAC